LRVERCSRIRVGRRGISGPRQGHREDPYGLFPDSVGNRCGFAFVRRTVGERHWDFRVAWAEKRRT